MKAGKSQSWDDEFETNNTNHDIVEMNRSRMQQKENEWTNEWSIGIEWISHCFEGWTESVDNGTNWFVSIVSEEQAKMNNFNFSLRQPRKN
jgi:hypothetical protein